MTLSHLPAKADGQDTPYKIRDPKHFASDFILASLKVFQNKERCILCPLFWKAQNLSDNTEGCKPECQFPLKT